MVPEHRVHSTMRVYLHNERLPSQAAVHRPGHTTVAQWMGRCFDCFTPTVGAYVNPTALLKQDGGWYTCAAFNVPERLGFGNLYGLGLRAILERVNQSAYVRRVREGGGPWRRLTRASPSDLLCGLEQAAAVGVGVAGDHPIGGLEVAAAAAPGTGAVRGGRRLHAKVQH
jgi:hypothetical protein